MLSASLLFVLAGCGESAEVATDPGIVGAGGSGGQPVPETLRFEPGDTLTVTPGESRTVSVVADPPAVYHVRFALLGDALNAALDRGEADTDAAGRAEVTLTAPTPPATAATFTVRANIGGVRSELPVAMSADGFARLQVFSSYAGKRSVFSWTASARVGTTCGSLTGTPPPDGDLVASSMLAQAPIIENVPVGNPVAVTLRSAHKLGGCLDVQKLSTDQLNTVVVTVIDRPMQLGEADLSLKLGLEFKQGSDALNPYINKLALAMLNGASTDAAALLDEMELAAGNPAEQTAFRLARQQYNWDDLVESKLGSATAIRARAIAWMKGGVSGFGGPDLIDAHLDATGSDEGSALLELLHLGTHGPEELGFAPSNQVMWSSAPGDSVLIGASLPYYPSRLLTTLAAGPAFDDQPAAQSVPEALAQAVNCPQIGNVLVANGASAGESFAGCDTACSRSLCTAGIAAMWQRAADHVGSSIDEVEMAVSGAATVDEEARPAGFVGAWVGTASFEALVVPLAGEAKAQKPQPP